FRSPKLFGGWGLHPGGGGATTAVLHGAPLCSQGLPFKRLGQVQRLAAVSPPRFYRICPI
ncbi:hypothetical protein, partial [Bordetella avium]|uniref:hypothetical protein n=1 Tax=Bordetella avium TaxID=521 RepID=UPI00307F6930